jgi:hypothetical protein
MSNRTRWSATLAAQLSQQWRDFPVARQAVVERRPESE